jgi:hypothetical protein
MGISLVYLREREPPASERERIAFIQREREPLERIASTRSSSLSPRRVGGPNPSRANGNQQRVLESHHPREGKVPASERKRAIASEEIVVVVPIVGVRSRPVLWRICKVRRLEVSLLRIVLTNLGLLEVAGLASPSTRC